MKSPVPRRSDPAGDPAAREWVGTRLNIFTAAYNTKLVKKEDLPKTYEDLLNPQVEGQARHRGRRTSTGSPGVIGELGEAKGLKLFRDIVATNGISVRKGHTLLTNLVVSGEVPLALTVYNYKAEQLKNKGAPIDWFAFPPAIARPNGSGVLRRAPHPHAAVLFFDFMLSDAQELLLKRDFIPTSKKVEHAAQPDADQVRRSEGDPGRGRRSGTSCTRRSSSSSRSSAGFEPRDAMGKESHYSSKKDRVVRARHRRASTASRTSSTRLRSMPRVIKGKELQFDDGPQSFSKHFIEPIDGLTQTLHIHLEEYAPGGRTQKHGHVNEAAFYILDGTGYEIHDGIRYDWQAGDVAIVHMNCVHQHFNADPVKPARALVHEAQADDPVHEPAVPAVGDPASERADPGRRGLRAAALRRGLQPLSWSW